MVKFLWRNREKPNFFSNRQLVVWAKRFLCAPALIRIAFYRWRLVSRGAQIGLLTIVYPFKLEGKSKNLFIGKESFIASGVHIAAHAVVKIGSRVVLNDGVKILTASHLVNDVAWGSYSREIVIEDYAWIATNAIILPGAHIGYGAVVGAGAVVTKDVPAFSVVVGNPSKITANGRPGNLSYSPVILSKAFEAWIGAKRGEAAGGVSKQ